MRQEPITSKIRHYAHRTWLVGLGAVGMIHKEGSKLLSDLVKEGKAFEARRQEAAHAEAEAQAGPKPVVKVH